MLRPDDTPVEPVKLLCLPPATGGRVLELTEKVGKLEPRQRGYVITRGGPQRGLLGAVLAHNEAAYGSLRAISRRPCDASVNGVRAAGRLLHPDAARPPA